VLGLGRQANQQIKRGILQVIEGLSVVPGNIDVQFGHDGNGETVDVALAYAGGIEKYPIAEKMPPQTRCHRRAHGIEIAGK
jgi:hypothetical protein